MVSLKLITGKSLRGLHIESASRPKLHSTHGRHKSTTIVARDHQFVLGRCAARDNSETPRFLGSKEKPYSPKDSWFEEGGNPRLLPASIVQSPTLCTSDSDIRFPGSQGRKGSGSAQYSGLNLRHQHRLEKQKHHRLHVESHDSCLEHKCGC